MDPQSTRHLDSTLQLLFSLPLSRVPVAEKTRICPNGGTDDEATSSLHLISSQMLRGKEYDDVDREPHATMNPVVTPHHHRQTPPYTTHHSSQLAARVR